MVTFSIFNTQIKDLKNMQWTKGSKC